MEYREEKTIAGRRLHAADVLEKLLGGEGVEGLLREEREIIGDVVLLLRALPAPRVIGTPSEWFRGVDFERVKRQIGNMANLLKDVGFVAPEMSYTVAGALAHALGLLSQTLQLDTLPPHIALKRSAAALGMSEARLLSYATTMGGSYRVSADVHACGVRYTMSSGATLLRQLTASGQTEYDKVSMIVEAGGEQDPHGLERLASCSVRFEKTDYELPRVNGDDVATAARELDLPEQLVSIVADVVAERVVLLPGRARPTAKETASA